MKTHKKLNLGQLSIPADRPYLIAEAGVNHENDLTTAIKMVEQAAEAGVDAIKFQSYRAETLASRNSPAYWDLNSEPTTSQFELFKKLDHFGPNQYTKLAARAKEVGIDFLSTPFDFEYADFLANIMPAFKIASADLTNLPFLEHIAKKGLPMILSVGASTLSEVDEAVSLVKKCGNKQIALLHCVLSYPCKAEDANLNIIKTLQKTYPEYCIGYSDHVPPDKSASVLTTSWLLGARIIEKHFTLDKSLKGNDHYHAMDPDDVRTFRKQCKLISSLLGQSRKEVLVCEEPARLHARRSLVANKALNAGETIRREHIAIKRPGHGIEPRHLALLLGKKVRRDIDEDEILTWEAFLETN